MPDLERLTKKMDKLQEDLNEKIKEVEELSKEYAMYSEALLIEQGTHIRVICPACRGNTYLTDGDRKIQCDACKGRGYLWMEKYDKNE